MWHTSEIDVFVAVVFTDCFSVLLFFVGPFSILFIFCTNHLLSFFRTRPDGLANLIQNGVPDVLRGVVWQCLANVQADPELTQTYRLLLGKVWMLKLRFSLYCK